MSKSNAIIKVILAGVAIFGVYKLYKVVEKSEKEKAEKLEEHKKQILEDIEGAVNQTENQRDSIKNLTLNNENLVPSDRAYAYDMYKSKLARVKTAKSIKSVDEAAEEFREFLDILIEAKDPETFSTYLAIQEEKKRKDEEEKKEKARLDLELKKNQAIVDAVEKLGTKVVCKLVQ